MDNTKPTAADLLRANNAKIAEARARYTRLQNEALAARDEVQQLTIHGYDLQAAQLKEGSK
jgi:hypothetical protein